MDHLLAATYRAEQHHFWFRGLTRFTEPWLADAVAGVTRPEILDCGCGTGANMRRLTRYGRVTGFDLQPSGLAFARAYDQERLVQASIAAIPFAAESFDLVTAFDVLACLDPGEERAAAAEMHRVLKPGGALILNTAALPLLRGQHAMLWREVRRHTRRTLRALLDGAGFRIVRLTYTNFSLLPLMLPVRLAQRVLGLSTPEEASADLVVPAKPINAALSALVALEARALRVTNMPVGSSLLALARRPSKITASRADDPFLRHP
jgi:SAM-dependent methyltransferase